MPYHLGTQTQAVLAALARIHARHGRRHQGTARSIVSELMMGLELVPSDANFVLSGTCVTAMPRQALPDRGRPRP